MFVLARQSFPALLLALFLGMEASSASAADVVPAASPVPAEVSPGWSFRFVPYGWLTAMNGTQTVRGRSVKVNASFADIVEKSDTLVALMGNVEARNGPWALYGDLVWSSLSFGADTTRTRSPVPAVVGSVGASLGLDVQMLILEVGAAYEVLRSGPVALDILGGARYWHQEADLSLDLAGTLDIGDLERTGLRAIARSGSVDWIDPLIGARLRLAVAPGQELILRGDIGGFDVGSRFSWQLFGGYSFDFGTYRSVTFSGVIGYRALYVDYVKGEGRDRYEFDMLQHGPLLGLSMRF